jgi:hypothetical protein
MVVTMAKMASVARKENLAKIGMRSFFNKVGAPYLDQLPKRCKAHCALRIAKRSKLRRPLSII